MLSCVGRFRRSEWCAVGAGDARFAFDDKRIHFINPQRCIFPTPEIWAGHNPRYRRGVSAVWTRATSALTTFSTAAKLRQ